MAVLGGPVRPALLIANMLQVPKTYSKDKLEFIFAKILEEFWKMCHRHQEFQDVYRSSWFCDNLRHFLNDTVEGLAD